MSNTGKQIDAGRGQSTDGGIASGSSVDLDEKLSPRVEALRKLVAAGQYQVSARYLAYRIFRAADLRIE
jgi:anti-sigma28 factor (negative regulator of flagellin synthesis)